MLGAFDSFHGSGSGSGSVSFDPKYANPARNKTVYLVKLRPEGSKEKCHVQNWIYVWKTFSFLLAKVNLHIFILMYTQKKAGNKTLF